MHTQYTSVHPWGVVPLCARRIQYPLACGRHSEVIWGQPQVIPDCGGSPKTPTAAAHYELVRTTRRGNVKCEWDYGQGERPRVYAIWVRPPSRILQEIWEADPVHRPVWVSKLDVTDAYHRGTLHPDQVEAFAYVAPEISKGNCVITCINLVLPMGWVDPPKYFCAFSETLTDKVNALMHTLLPVKAYGAILEIPETSLGPPHTIDSLTHIDC